MRRIAAALVTLFVMTSSLALYHLYPSQEESASGGRPYIEIVSPEGGDTVSGHVIIRVAWSARWGLKEIVISIDGRGVSRGVSDIWMWNTSKWEDGEHEVGAVMTDGHGNQASHRIRVTVRNAIPHPPVVQIISPLGGYYNHTPSVRFSVQDPDGDLTSITLWVDDRPFTLQARDGIYDFDTPVLEEGVHRIAIEALDRDGMDGFNETSFVLDITPPTIQKTTHAGWHVLPIRLDWEVADETGVVENTLKVDGAIIYMGPKTSYILSGLADGLHTVHISSIDRAGNRGHLSFEMRIDNTPPDVTISSPAPGVWRGTVDVDAIVTDRTSGISALELTVDGVLVSEVLPYSLDTTRLEDGDHLIEVTATDEAGLRTGQEIGITVDNTPPHIEILSPAEDMLEDEILLDADVYDITYAPVVIYLDGLPIGEPPMEIDTALYPDGEHNLTFRSTDEAGNTNEVGLNLTFDNNPPIVKIINPTPDRHVGGTVNVTVACHDLIGISWLRVSVDDSAISSSTAFSLDTRQLSDGSHILNATASDLMGHLSSDEISFLVDNTPPEIVNLSVHDGDRVAGSVEISFDVQDLSEIAQTAIYLDGEIVAHSNRYVWDTTSHDEGLASIHIMAQDEVGNVAHVYLNLTVDNVNPVKAWFTSPADGAFLRGTINIVVTARDDEAEIDEFVLYCDGELVATSEDGNFTFDTRDYDDGSHNITAVVRDHAGNVNSTWVNVVFDNTPPDLEILKPAGDVIKGSVNISVRSIDPISGVDFIAFLVNSTVLQNSTAEQVFWNNTGLPDDTYEITAIAGDGAGNWISLHKDVDLDAHPPQVWFVDPKQDAFLRNTVWVEAITSDRDVSSVEIRLNDDTVSSDWTWTWDTTCYEDGGYHLNLTATDRFGNSTEISVHVVVDNTPPEVNITSPSSYYISGTCDLIAHPFDAYGISYVSIVIDGEEVSNSTSQYYIWMTSNWTDGPHTVHAIACDLAGNWNTTCRTYWIDNTLPSVEITSPEHGSHAEGLVQVNCSADDNTGVDRVVFYVETTLLETDRTPPFSAVWNTTDLADGNYTITCVAFDVAGNRNSTSIVVRVGEEETTVVEKPDHFVLEPYDLDGIERLVMSSDSDYEAVPYISPLVQRGVLPSVMWRKDNNTDKVITYTSVSIFSSRLAISCWTSPGRAIVVDSYRHALLVVPLARFLDAPVLLYGDTTDEALWRLGTIHADQIIVMGNTPYNSRGVTVIQDDEILSFTLGAAILSGYNPDYLVVANPDDTTANTPHLSAFSGAFAVAHDGVLVPVSASSSHVDHAVHDAFATFDDFDLIARYVCIVGDHISVPFYYGNYGLGNTPSDNKYGDRDGDPVTLEVAVGRVIAKTLKDISYYLDRIVNYRDYLAVERMITPPLPRLNPLEWNNNAVIYMGWFAEFAEDSENHCREYMRTFGMFNTQDDTDVAHAGLVSQLMADFAMSNYIVINADHGQPTGTMTFQSDDLLDLHPSVVFGVSCSVGRIDGVNKESSLTYTFMEKGANVWLAPTRTAYGSYVQTYPYQPIAAPGLCYLYITNVIDGDLTSGWAMLQAKNDLIQHGNQNVNKGTCWQYVHYGDPAFNPYEPANEGMS